MTAPAAAIELHDVWRRYRVVSARRPRGLRASLSRDPLRRRADQWFWALRSVELSVRSGDALAIIGRNGAGKSTLLRLVGGVGRPDRGTLSVRGRVGALVDLGHEFHGDLTGRQNAVLAGIVAGMTRKEVRARLDEIVEFADLADFVDEPLRAYSDGMRTRLAFSIMVHVDPDVLLVDEVLAVGDAPFQRRSVERIEELRAHGAAVVFVSHDLGLVRRVCDRAVWLERGEITAQGEPRDVVAEYLEAMSGEQVASGASRGTARGSIQAVQVRDEWGAPTARIRGGDGLMVDTRVDLPPELAEAMLRVRIIRAATNLAVVDTSTPVDQRSTVMRVHFERLDLAPGEHRLEVGLHSVDWSTLVDEIDPVALMVAGDGPDTASLAPPHRWVRRTDLAD